MELNLVGAINQDLQSPNMWSLDYEDFVSDFSEKGRVLRCTVRKVLLFPEHLFMENAFMLSPIANFFAWWCYHVIIKQHCKPHVSPLIASKPAAW